MQVIFDRYLDADNAKGMHNVNRDFKEGFECCKRMTKQITVIRKDELQEEAFRIKCLEWISELETEICTLTRKKRELETKANKLASSARVKEANELEYGEIRLLNFDISKKQKLINEIKGKCNGF